MMTKVLENFEFWELPLLAAGVILLGYVAYVGIAKWAPRIVASRIRLAGLVGLDITVPVLCYLLLTIEALSFFPALIAVVAEIFLAWATRHELRDLRRLIQEKQDKQAQEAAQKDREPAGQA
jgi:hypothetical protein